MMTSVVTLERIKSKLVKLPADKLPEIYDFVEFILKKSKPKEKNIVKLEGIWKGLGFEKIADLEGEIKKIRRYSEKSISERINQWNT